MKCNWVALVLTMLLLCGCESPPAPTVPPTEPTAPDRIFETEPTEPPGLYDPDHPLEQVTQGAVQVFPLDTRQAAGIRFMGEDILLFTGNDRTTLTKLAGADRYIAAEVTLPCFLDPDDPVITVDGQGVTYFDPLTRDLVFLNTELLEEKRIPLNMRFQGNPALSPNRQYLYYLTEDTLRVRDLVSSTDRVLTELHLPQQRLEMLHRNGTVIQCSAVYSDGSWNSLFFSSETGSILYETPGDVELRTCGDFYFTDRPDGWYRELIAGSEDFGPSVLVPADPYTGLEPVPGLQGVLLYHTADDATALDFYDLASGTHPYRLVLPGSYYPVSLQPDPRENALWFLVFDSQTQNDILCRWQPDLSVSDDPGRYLQSRYTRDIPDEAGLARCAQLAEEISQRHGIEIRIWEDAVARQPWDYTLVSEYQVPLIEQRLRDLDRILSRYPEDFLLRAASETDHGRLILCLVRSIEGKEHTGALKNATGLQYWDDEANAYLAITPDYAMEQNLYHELFHILDSRVLSLCSEYDDWNKLNPKDFSYDNSYEANLLRDDWELTSGDTQYFIDLYSMSYAKEDRARIMEYAMLPEQAHLFQTDAMQKKLRQLCFGLRVAFDLELYPQILPWEQYLKEPLTP